ncbi:MAG: DUF1320 family protein, partial [Sulfuricaulis sp.]|nr:DUF1320 family protein [Sulfuricaulis sp.]
PLQATLDQVTLLVRGYVSQRTTPGAAGTIPDSLKASALDIAAYRLAKRAGHRTDLLQSAHDAAIALLEKIAKGEVKLADAEVGIEVVTKTTRAADRSKLDGL